MCQFLEVHTVPKFPILKKLIERACISDLNTHELLS